MADASAHPGRADEVDEVRGAEVSRLGYAEAARELDEIVAFFEQRDVDVDQLVAKLERATAIVVELDRRLRRTRVQVEELVPRLEAIVDGRDGSEELSVEDEPFEDDLPDDDLPDDDLPFEGDPEDAGGSPGPPPDQALF